MSSSDNPLVVWFTPHIISGDRDRTEPSLRFAYIISPYTLLEKNRQVTIVWLGIRLDRLCTTTDTLLFAGGGCESHPPLYRYIYTAPATDQV